MQLELELFPRKQNNCRYDFGIKNSLDISSQNRECIVSAAKKGESSPCFYQVKLKYTCHGGIAKSEVKRLAWLAKTNNMKQFMFRSNK